MVPHEMNDSVRYTLDAAAATVAVATIAKMLPPVAALLSIIWLLVQLYDRFRFGPKQRRQGE